MNLHECALNLHQPFWMCTKSTQSILNVPRIYTEPLKWFYTWFEISSPIICVEEILSCPATAVAHRHFISSIVKPKSERAKWILMMNLTSPAISEKFRQIDWSRLWDAIHHPHRDSQPRSSLNQGTKHQKLPPSHSNISLELAVTFTKSSSTRKIPFSFWSRYEAAKASSITFSCTSLAFTFSNKSTRDSSSRTLTQN